MGSNVEGRELKKNCTRIEAWTSDLAGRLLRSLSAFDSYSEKWDYIEQNPVRAGLVEHTKEWPYRGIIQNLML
jgi:hypothetical protein